ncbi:hypothetical protein DsansV1_C05g0051321 [Dioscorea sansibarensis]
MLLIMGMVIWPRATLVNLKYIGVICIKIPKSPSRFLFPFHPLRRLQSPVGAARISVKPSDWISFWID